MTIEIYSSNRVLALDQLGFYNSACEETDKRTKNNLRNVLQ